MIAIVSSIPTLLQQSIAFAMRPRRRAPGAPRHVPLDCNASATALRNAVHWMSCILSFLLIQWLSGASVRAQEPDPVRVANAPAEHRASACVAFVGGAAVGFLAHESGHLVLDLAFGADPGVQRVSFGGIPFFAITHGTVTPRQEFAISSAGFWVQHATSEWILASHPNLRHEREPFLTGWIEWTVLASAASSYAAV